jgi:hypothetical protein
MKLTNILESVAEFNTLGLASQRVSKCKKPEEMR